MAPGKRRKHYTQEDLEEARAAVSSGTMSLRQAQEEFGVPKSTLNDRSTGSHSNKQGAPPILTPEEEDLMCEMVKILAAWGFPFSGQDLCYFVKSYLDKKGVTNVRFKDNLPTHRWVTTFLGRHKELSLRQCNAIKRSRAAVSREDIDDFLNNFTVSMEGVAPEGLYNYDETCFRNSIDTYRVPVPGN
jgi:hypothetical protein